MLAYISSEVQKIGVDQRKIRILEHIFVVIKNHNFFGIKYIRVFCSMTDRTTDQVNYKLDDNCHRESTQTNQMSILNSIREINDFLQTEGQIAGCSEL